MRLYMNEPWLSIKEFSKFILFYYAKTELNITIISDLFHITQENVISLYAKTIIRIILYVYSPTFMKRSFIIHEIIFRKYFTFAIHML